MVDSLLKCSGAQGCYVEIRAQDGSRNDEGYHTIWLPRKTLQEVRAEQTVLTESSAIIRVGHRYGLRFAISDAQTAHQKIKQDGALILGIHQIISAEDPR